MNCSELHDVLPEIADSSENIELQAHLKTCVDCSELVSDLELIASQARQLSEADEPAPRVWVKIAAELRAEGIIRDAEVAPARPVLVPTVRRRWNAWWLVPVAAALVIAGSYAIKSRSAEPMVSQNPPAAVNIEKAPVTSSNDAAKATAAPTPTTPQKSTVANVQDETPNRAPMMTVGTSDQELLDGVSPDMRSAYASQLRAVNAYIRDANAYVKQNPEDEDARQHLMDAYEQREMLYQMALDHVQ